MRTNLRKNLSLVAAVMALICFPCCSKEELQNSSDEESGFSLQRNVVEMTAEGGSAELLYFVENPVEGLGVEIKYDADWIGGFDTSEEGKITFEVQPQTLQVETRSTEVEVYYGEEMQSFTVTQSGNDAIAFELVTERITSFVTSVVPKDPEMRFWINVMETKDMKGMTDDDILAYDLEIFKDKAEITGMTLEEWYVQEFVNTKYLSPYLLSKGLPGTSYTAYVYGMNGLGERLTPIYKVAATTNDFEENIDAAFKIENIEVKDGVLTANVKPSDKNILYYVDFEQRPESEYSLEDIRLGMQSYLDGYMFMFLTDPRVDVPPTLEEVIAMLFRRGDSVFEMSLDEPKRGGRMFAFAIDEKGLISSELTVVNFDAETQKSDNKISVNVENVGVKSANWTSSTTNDDPYVVKLGKIADYSGMTNDKVLEELLTEPDLSIYEGNASGTLDNLEPNTGYVLFAFGYEDGVATTNLVREEFYTSAEQEELGCRIIYKYFDGSELYDSDPERFSTYWNKVVVVAEALVSGNPESYYYGLFTSRLGENDDASLIDILTAANPSVLTTPVGVFTSMYNREVCFISVAKGTDGNFSPVERNYVTFTVDGTSPIEDFPENL